MISVRLLLIFAILACPYNCMGAFEGESLQSVATPACSCCSSVSFEPDTAPFGLPESPDNDCPCPTCLCSGAVLVADSLSGDIADDESQPSFDLLAASLTVESQAATSCAPLSTRAAPAFPVSGRFVRILHESFLL